MKIYGAYFNHQGKLIIRSAEAKETKKLYTISSDDAREAAFDYLRMIQKSKAFLSELDALYAMKDVKGYQLKNVRNTVARLEEQIKVIDSAIAERSEP